MTRFSFAVSRLLVGIVPFLGLCGGSYPSEAAHRIIVYSEKTGDLRPRVIEYRIFPKKTISTVPSLIPIIASTEKRLLLLVSNVYIPPSSRTTSTSGGTRLALNVRGSDGSLGLINMSEPQEVIVAFLIPSLTISACAMAGLLLMNLTSSCR
jgi:hypothetical protein